MRLGIVGAGLAGRSHLLDAVTNPRFELVGVVARHRQHVQAIAEDFGLSGCFDSLPALLRVTAAEALVVATPPAVTPSIMHEALDAGCRVLVEKPAGPAAAELIDRVEHAASRSDRVVVGYNRRYQFHVHRCRQLLAAARPHEVRCVWTGFFADRYRSATTYRHAAAWGQGVLLDTVSHIVDTLLFLGLGPATVLDGRLVTVPDLDVDVGAFIALRLRDNCPGHGVVQECAGSVGTDTWRIEIVADRGDLTLSERALSGVWDNTPMLIKSGDLRRPVDDLLALVDGAPTYGASLTDAIAVLHVLDAIRHSATTPSRRWQRPRAKALGRLNGAC